jgi:hypothetical protein
MLDSTIRRKITMRQQAMQWQTCDDIVCQLDESQVVQWVEIEIEIRMS